MKKTVAFHNLGCKVNSYEMEMMIKTLAGKGFIIVPFDQKADIYIVNTCSVTNIADRKSRQMIHRARTANPDAVIVAAGCYVNTHGSEEVTAEGVDICVVNEQKKDIADILDSYLGRREAGEACAQTDISDIEALHTRCFIKVQDGCDQFCTYCIIPYARGRIHSRPIAEIVDDIKGYVSEGYKEFVPTGIHISSYGKDRSEDGEDLLRLLERISDIDGVKRIRLSSLEPRLITEDFARSLSRTEQLCPHFHLSLQSGSDAVLGRMNRHYTTGEYIQAVDILRDHFNDPAVTTDIITGFPGETEEEFRETVDFVEKVGFYETHIFKYSRRRGTAADRMEGQLPEKVKHERSNVLLEINKRKKSEFEDRHISERAVSEVLFEDTEDIAGKTYRTGYTREYIKVCAAGDRYHAGDIATGTIRRQSDIIIFEDRS
ncbi:MAG: tRNA (N(6)-L-threonylcarbamoyladenosine(37)-C(2))-methylthiotransferase MtaB [Lachnospiraceae bacterium]|nr:tRNA (N(6)-L-threonylcarbamoyladenosine(37)-C(2))-methylthiotransferase MtaB [Lachnospiraceae bacterium]